MKRAFITGANGFVGRALTNFLLDQGWRVRAGIRRPGSLSGTHHDALEEVIVDGLTPNANWRAALEDVDVVFHLAARVHHLREDKQGAEQLYQTANHLGTKALLDQAVQADVSRFIFLSSVKAVGEHSLPGDPWGISTQCQPMDAYGRSKRDAETAVREADLDAVILRLPLVFGPGVRGNMLKLLEAVASNKPLPLGMVKNRRSFLGLANLVHAIHHVAESPQAKNKTFFLSEAKAYSTPGIIRMIGDSLGARPRLLKVPSTFFRVAGVAGSSLEAILRRPMPINRPMVARLLGDLEVDGDYIREETGWAQPYSTEHEIRQMVLWFREMKESQGA